ncbi:MAG TPA: SH3 domain-containing protein [Clostridiales bacterium]|nr:SH3 domain-containing protein [Clostridiales bacterium]
MPSVFLSPSTQEWNPYIIGGNEEEYMNMIADRMEPYLRASGIDYVRNDPSRAAAGAIADSNAGNYDVHLALHSNAAPERLSGKLRGIDIYYAPYDGESQRLARIIANNFMLIYPLPDKSRAVPATNLGEVLRTRAVANLAEIGYHDNVEDATWISNNIGPIARNLVLSLTDYFGIPFVEPGAVRTGVVVTDGSNLNLRSYPSTSGAILGVIPNGTNLIIQGETNGWFVVSYNGRTGYSSAEFIEIV